MKKAIFNWSGGKDSSLALHKVLQNDEFKIESLMTSVNEEFNRISMHGVRRELLIEQANSIGLPLEVLEIPKEVSMESYDQLMREKMASLKTRGITHSIFGDIFLEDLKKYREQRLSEVGLKGVFPLWNQDTSEAVREFIDLGFKAITVCIDAQKLDESFVGRIIDQNFLSELPKDVDPCGENGEFHSFVFDGPIFNSTIQFKIGEKVKRDYPNANEEWNNSFWFCDLEMEE